MHSMRCRPRQRRLDRARVAARSVRRHRFAAVPAPGGLPPDVTRVAGASAQLPRHQQRYLHKYLHMYPNTVFKNICALLPS